MNFRSSGKGSHEAVCPINSRKYDPEDPFALPHDRGFLVAGRRNNAEEIGMGQKYWYLEIQ
jgi:hypothetical protein